MSSLAPLRLAVSAKNSRNQRFVMVLLAAILSAFHSLPGQDATNDLGSSGAIPPDLASHPPSLIAMAESVGEACVQGDLNRVKVLVDLGASVDLGGGPYQTPPLIAAIQHPDIIAYLLEKGAKVDDEDSLGNSALLTACYWGRTDTALALLKAGADSNHRNKEGRLPLMNAAMSGDDDLVRALLAHHADVNGNNDAGPAIWRAAENGHVSTLELLLASGADLKLKPDPVLPERRSWSFLGDVAQDNRLEMIDLLLRLGISVDDMGKDGTTGLMQAVLYEQPLTVAKLLQAGAQVNLANEAGETALLVGTIHFQPDIFAALLNAHANVNASDKDGQTPLMLAVQYQKGPVWRALLLHGANLEAKDKQGRTALIISCLHLYSPAATFLINQGADINIADATGKTALAYAGDRGGDDIVALLKARGARQTEVHILPKERPNPPLSPARAWVLAAGAIYPQDNGDDPFVLGYPGTETVEEVRDSLKDDWDVDDAAGLRDELEWLRTVGHRTRFQAEGVELVAIDDAVFNVMTAANPLPEAEALRSGSLKWKTRLGLAWDLCRYINLVNWGYHAKYLDEKEAWDLLTPVAQDLQKNFSSWQEMSDNFLDGRQIWANGDRDETFDACARLLLDPHDPNSPWNASPWTTDLSSP